MDDTIDNDTSTSIPWIEPKNNGVILRTLNRCLLGPPRGVVGIPRGVVGGHNKFYWDEI
jgi:hypothetical protein